MRPGKNAQFPATRGRKRRSTYNLLGEFYIKSISRQRFYVFLAVLSMFFRGITFVSTKVLLTYISPIQIMLLRYIIGYIGLLVIHPRFHRSEGGKQELMCLLAALCGSTLYFLAENFALTITQASNVSLLISAAPILTSVIASVLVKDERMSKGEIYCFLLAMTGIFLVVYNGSFVLGISPIGDLLAITAALMWAFYSIILRKITTKYSPIYITRRIFFYSIITMLPFRLLDTRPLDLSVLANPVVLLNLLFLGLVASALCYVLWYHVVGALGAIKANNFVYLNPLITMVASVIVLHERVTWIMLLGALLILLGVMLAQPRPKRDEIEGMVTHEQA